MNPPFVNVPTALPPEPGPGPTASAEQSTGEQLRIARQYFERAFEDAPIGMALVATDGHFLLVNRALCEITARAESDLLALDFRAITHPEDLDADEALLGELIAGTRENYRLDKRYVRPDGSEVPVSLHASVVRRPDGTPAYFIAQVIDISHRRHLEDALRTAETRWRTAFERGPVGMAIVALDEDARGRIVSANRALAALLGRATTDIEGRALPELASTGHDAAQITALLARVAEPSAGRQDSELYVRHADGYAVAVEVTVTVDPGPGDGPVAIVHLHDLTERKVYEARLEHLADHDPLTGFFNRRRFDEELERAVAHQRRHGRPGALFLLDLDQFKYVNDTYGHLAGDEVIQHAGSVLRARLRDTDVIARIGGDEFAVILGETEVAAARRVADELLEELRAHPPLMRTGQRLALTASIGIVPIAADRALSPGELLMEADIAMYDAKDAGRNQVAIAAPGRHTHAKMKARLSWAERIRRALENDSFELHAQPIVRTGDGRVDRYELLIRLRDTDDALIPPGRFLYIAERFGQIQEIDQWVMRQAVGLLATTRDVGFAVNLSGASIGDERTVGLLAELLDDAQVDPGRLTVEITETAAIRSIDVARGFAQRLSELGCLLALDDFGAGFGSFFYLKHLPFTCVKIDGEFIRGMTTSRSDRLTVEAIVGLAKGLGKRTTAEFVADAETFGIVRELGVDFVQGFHTGRPGPLSDLALRDQPAAGPGGASRP